MAHDEVFEIASIQPIGTGTEVRANGAHEDDACVDELIAFHCGSVRSHGVPRDLVSRFLGKTFTRHELEARRARILDDGRVLVTWLGQPFFLAPRNGRANGHTNGRSKGHINGHHHTPSDPGERIN